MSGPSIFQTDDRIGFNWVSESGKPATLRDVVAAPDSEPNRLVPTHLEALDDVLIAAAERFGEVLGGGRLPADAEEEQELRELHRAIDRLCHEYADALVLTGFATDIRGGQIVGTAALISIRIRMALGTLGPAPLTGELDEPSVGVVAGFGDMVQVDPAKPWKGGRWVVRTEEGKRFPATLPMLMFDSSGVYKDAALDEHREALRSVVAAANADDADPLAVACAVDWLLYDWLMAHRDGPSSGAIEIKSGRTADAAMIVAAADASAVARATIDPGLLDLPRH